jgi:hypothetical protein
MGIFNCRWWVFLIVADHTDLQLEKWEEEKDHIKVELQAMMDAFEGQLLEAKSYVQAQLDLGV